MTRPLDSVHDIGHAFRLLVEAFSFPGKAVDLSELTCKAPDCDGLPGVFSALAITLLDTETSFCYVGGDAERTSKAITNLTFARPTGLSEAQWVYCEGDPADVIPTTRRGTLEQPHLGAMIFVLCPSFERGPTYRLSGPGIEVPRQTLTIDLSPEWLNARNQHNSEYPLGIDLVLVSPAGQLVALPRTTQIERVKTL